MFGSPVREPRESEGTTFIIFTSAVHKVELAQLRITQWSVELHFPGP